MRWMLLAALVAPLLATPPAVPRQPPRLVPARLSPLEIKGTGFHSREQVDVTVTPMVGSPVSQRTRADRHGSFHITFRAGACNGIEAVAAGRRGSRASFVFSTALDCPGA